MKVAVIFHRFGPYHCARLEAAARRCEVLGIELGGETSEYGWAKVKQTHSFKRVSLFPEADSRRQATNELETRMSTTLAASKPDVVAVPGWSEKGALIALRWAIEKEIPVVLMSETTAGDEARVWWKEWVKRRIARLCSSALVGGERHKTYLSDLGMAAERVFVGYDAVDNEYFARNAKEVRGQKSEVRRELGLPENYFLASARFIPKKNLDSLVRAYASYRMQASGLRLPSSDPWSLVILGDGPLKDDLRSLISDLSLQDSVLLPGFKQYEDLPVYYGLANAFIHASRVEQWGLVVNEAMASGLPVIVSNRCGCVPELVHDGINGYTYNPDDVPTLSKKMMEMAAMSSDERAAFGEEGARIVAEFGPERFAIGLEQGADAAMKSSRRKLSTIDGLMITSLLKR